MVFANNSTKIDPYLFCFYDENKPKDLLLDFDVYIHSVTLDTLQIKTPRKYTYKAILLFESVLK